jgi:hypothetical protein
MLRTCERLKLGRRGRIVLWGVVLCWFAAVLGGFGLLGRDEQSPGPSADAPRDWPADSRFRPTPGRACLVLALHPRCPCSRATLEGLAEILDRAGDRVDAHILFYVPTGCGEEWARTELWDQAAALGSVRLWCDEDGREARRFGAATSGDATVYGPDGRLLFHGGITGGRGQVGDNEGLAAVVAHLLGESARAGTDVFGCPLRAQQPSVNHPVENKCSDEK